MNIAVAAVIKRRLPFFVRLADSQMGQWGYFLVKGLRGSPGSLSATKSLIAALSSPSGKANGREIWEAQRCLRSLGSSVVIGRGRGLLAEIRSEFKISAGKLVPGTFLKSGPGSAGGSCFLYIFQRKPSPPAGLSGTKIINPAMGTFVFNYGKEFLLRPIAEKILREARPGLGLKLPSAGWLVYYANNDGAFSQTTATGKKLPRVIIRRPRLDDQ